MKGKIVDEIAYHDQLQMFPGKRARARRTDPETSAEAAESVKNVTETQRAVLAVLNQYGPACDQDIFLRLAEAGYRVSPSGARTRRKELSAAGQVEWAGWFIRLRSGRRSRVWRLPEWLNLEETLAAL
jgi:hypothetical protein